MRVACRNLSVAFPSNGTRIDALNEVSFAAAHGEFVSIVGPSGSGKTTLLRTIAGFVRPDAGTVEHGAPAAGGLMVYQENSLFPWMTVIENACFGLVARGVPRAEAERRARPLLARFGIGGREHAWPHELSVGMKQRISLIRAFLSDADLLLMDEPFGALDLQMRLALQFELLSLWEEDHKTVLFVTHDVEEAILLADRVVVLGQHPGKVIAEYPIRFERPRHARIVLTEDCLATRAMIYRDLGIYEDPAVHAR